MVRVLCFQLLKQQIYGIFEILIVLSGFACINQINQHGEILLLLRSFIPDISDQCRIIELFSLDPEVLTGLLSLSFGVDYDRVYKFQNILFAP